jgi:DNA polymerase-3 subunit alpha
MAALLTSEKDNTDKVVSYIAEARSAGREVLPPDVNHSDLEFSVVDGRIRFGLGAIKGVGESAIEAVLEARAAGPFKSLFEFCERVDSRRVNRKVIEALVKAGAFDFEKRARRQLFESIDRALERGSSSQRDRLVGQGSLLGLLGSQPTEGRARPAISGDDGPADEWPEKERLAFEKEAIGFYVSGHPLHQYQKELRRYARSAISIQNARRDERVTVAGVISTLRERPTRAGKRMAWATLEDLTGSVPVVCFPARDGGRSVMGSDGRWARGSARSGFENWEALLKGDEPVLVVGTVQVNQRDEEQPVGEIIAEEIQLLREAREKRVKRLELKVPAQDVSEDRLTRLVELANRHSGPTQLAVFVLMPGEAEVLIATRLKVSVTDELLAAVDKLFGSPVCELG